MSLSSQSPALVDPPVVADPESPSFLLPGPGADERQRKGWSLLISLGVQVLGGLALVGLVRFLPPPARFFYPISQRHWTVVRLEAPPASPPPLRILRKEILPPPRRRSLPPVALPVPTRTAPEPQREVPLPIASPAPRPGPSHPVEVQHPVETAPPAVRPVLKIDPPAIKVGRFGDPQGVTVPATTAHANALQVGAFDGGNAAHGSVAPPSGARTGAFASLDGPPNPGANVSQAKVHIHSFDVTTAPSALPKPPPIPVPAAEHPPVILSHPVPVYTAQAQRNHIEGEVVLQAVLQRDGSVRILRVVQGLGYGLDGAARDAAHKLRFRPALRDGQPVDWTVLLHITFRMAY